MRSSEVLDSVRQVLHSKRFRLAPGYLVPGSARCVSGCGTSMFKSRSGLPHVPVRARLELGCTRPSQAIMAAWLIALEATRAPDCGVELVSSSTTSSGLRTPS